jgi:ABC-2 type transport system ATP-binding protein
MDEAATLADRVGIVDHGRLLALDTPAALTRGLTGSSTLEIVVESLPGEPAEALSALEKLENVVRAERVSDGGAGLRVRLYVEDEPARLVAPVASAVESLDGRLTEVRLGEPSLEDVFINLTGRALR